MNLFQKIKKGVKAGIMAMTFEVKTEKEIFNTIDTFENSQERHLMTVGEKYYKCQNDILKREMYRTVKGEKIKEENKANNKLVHSKYHAMVDEKIQYSFSKPFTLSGANEEYNDKIEEILGKHFSNKLKDLAYEASNKGKGWLHVYIDEKGDLKFKVIPAEQIIPVWENNNHNNLLCVFRKYITYKWLFGQRKEIIHIEKWTNNSVEYYIQDNNILLPDEEKNNIKGHYLKNGQWRAWGAVPFVCFKNNRIEMPDIVFVKSLIDNYDKSRSEVANFIEEVKNLIYVLKGYGGDNALEFIRTINEDRAIIIDDPTDGGVDTLNPTMDISAIKEHYEQLRRDIYEDGQSVDKDMDKYGSNPSGVALSFMYSGLDLKCSALESEFINSFEYMLKFIDIYLAEKNLNISGEITLIFNRAIKINETEMINNCIASKDLISNTIISHHPWVNNLSDELELIEEEEQEQYNSVPLVKENE